MPFSELSLLQFLQFFKVDVTIWEHCFTLLWIQISPHEVTTDSPLAVIFNQVFHQIFELQFPVQAEIFAPFTFFDVFCSHATLAVLESVILEQLARWQE